MKKKKLKEKEDKEEENEGEEKTKVKRLKVMEGAPPLIYRPTYIDENTQLFWWESIGK